MLGCISQVRCSQLQLAQARSHAPRIPLCVQAALHSPLLAGCLVFTEPQGRSYVRLLYPTISVFLGEPLLIMKRMMNLKPGSSHEEEQKGLLTVAKYISLSSVFWCFLLRRSPCLQRKTLIYWSQLRTNVWKKEMGKATTTQTLSYPLRLPDEAQADALRLLDSSREVINTVITRLWDQLDEFGTRTTTYAYKQVEEITSSPAAHGSRLWRCQAEQAGRILRGQAERKKQFLLILPLLEQGMIQPKTEQKRAGKKRVQIKQALTTLRDAQSDGGNAVELQSLIEQACNFYLANACFPNTYEDIQA